MKGEAKEKTKEEKSKNKKDKAKINNSSKEEVEELSNSNKNNSSNQGKDGNKLNKVILTILLILVIFVVAIGIIYGGRIINKAKLDRELENLVSKDISSVDLSNTAPVTSGEFAVVEETVKEFFKEYSDLRQQFMEKVNDSQLQSILTTENYEQDGPEFTESINYINTAKGEFNNIADELLNLLSTENIEARIKDKDIGDYYKDLYKGYFIDNNDLSTTFQETYQDTVDDKSLMNNLYDNEIKILNFLTENKAHWEVLDNKLTFDDQELANTFNDMKSNLYAEKE